MTSLTKEACAPLGVKPRDADRSKNFFALGLISWMYTRPEQPTIDWITEKFAKRPQVRDANLAAFRAGHAFGETAELFDHPYQVLPAPQKPGTYTNITGNTALAWGLVAAGQLAQLPGVPGLLPDHAGLRHPPRAVQAQELRRAHAAGRGRDRRHRRRPRRLLRRPPGRHHHQRPGRGPQVRDHRPGHQPRAAAADHRHPAGRALDRAAHQDRAEPTCCWPCTATTASRPLPIVAAYSPSNCFEAAIEAARLALTYRTPVILLSDGYLANGSEPWLLPDVDALPRSRSPSPPSPTTPTPTASPSSGPTSATPRPWPDRWPCPARPGLMHRIGGIEKEDGTGNISYDPANHGHMVDLRAAKIAGIAKDICRRSRSMGDVDDAELLIVGWGSTWGAISGAVDRVPRPGPQGGPDPPHAPQPVPAQPGRGPGAATPRCWCPR